MLIGIVASLALGDAFSLDLAPPVGAAEATRRDGCGLDTTRGSRLVGVHVGRGTWGNVPTIHWTDSSVSRALADQKDADAVYRVRVRRPIVVDHECGVTRSIAVVDATVSTMGYLDTYSSEEDGSFLEGAIGVLLTARWRRSLWSPSPSGVGPASQLYFHAEAAALGRGWRALKRSAVAPPAASLTLAMGAVTQRQDDLGIGDSAPDALWLPQFIPRGRCPFPGGGWPWRKRAARTSEVVESRPAIVPDPGVGNISQQPMPSGRVGDIVYVFWLLQFTPCDRGPPSVGGWSWRKRAPRTTDDDGLRHDASLSAVDRGGRRLGNQDFVPSLTNFSCRPTPLQAPLDPAWATSCVDNGRIQDASLDGADLGASWPVNQDFVPPSTNWSRSPSPPPSPADPAWVTTCDCSAVLLDPLSAIRPRTACGARKLMPAYRRNGSDSFKQQTSTIPKRGPGGRRTVLADTAASAWEIAAIALGLIHLGATLVGALTAPPASETTKALADAPRRRSSRCRTKLVPRIVARPKHGTPEAARWALEAFVIGGRRYSSKGRRGLYRAVKLGRPTFWDLPWSPWTCNEEADKEERWLVGRAGGGAITTRHGYVDQGCHSRYAMGESPDGATEQPRHRGQHSYRDSDTRRAARSLRPAVRMLGRNALTAATLAALLACRVGEAANLGPPDAPINEYTVTADLVDTAWRRAVEYPQPHRDGFRDICSPGFSADEGGGGARTAEEFALTAETVNSTGWGPLKRRLLVTKAHVVLAQETWTLQGQVANASAWARRHGWDSIWAPAKLGAGGGASGGVAIFARQGMGLRFPAVGTHVIEDARAVAGYCDPPGHRPIMLCSAYLIDGKGAKEPNKAILAKIGRKVEAQGAGCLALVGGDFQCHPSDMDATGFPDNLGGRVVAAGTARGTFRTASTSSCIDYFVVGGGLAEVVDEVATVEGCTSIKGHVPVQLRFQPRPVALKTLAVRQPPAITTERLYGPIQAPPCWKGPQRAADMAYEAAGGSLGAEAVQSALDAAYHDWCQLAELEIARATGDPPKKWGLRGQRPRLKWSSILPETVPTGGPSHAAVATWLKGTVTEMKRIATVTEEMAASGFYVETDHLRGNMPHGTTFAAPVRGGYGRRAAPSGAGGARGGRPRPSMDLAACLDIINDIRMELGDESGRTIDEDELVDLWGRAVDLGTRTKAAVEASQKWAYHGDAALRADADAAIADLAKAEKRWEEFKAREDSNGWKEWLEEDWAQGAKRAHAYTRVPVEWQPTVATSAKGVISAAPSAILEGARDKYAKYWDASESPIGYSWAGECEELPRLTPQQLRSASLSFSRRTSSTYDGWHVRHFGLISDEGLGVLATILAAVERAGTWPTQTTLATMPLIGKPKGGHRAIGKLAALYRVWTKSRRPFAEKWEAEHERPFFAAAAGVGPIDAVHRQAMRQEAACAVGGAAVVVLEDMEAFYESIDRSRLLEEAQALGFPTALVRASMAAYAAPRILSLDRVAARELYPRRGIIAGCTFATTFVKVLYLRKFDELAKTAPRGTYYDVFIDDVAITAEGPKAQVAANAATAHAMMRRALVEELGCQLAPQKAAIIASSREVGRATARALQQEEALVDVAPNLGVDATAGKRRRCIRVGSKKHGRFRAGKRRGWRLWAVARAVGRKALRIFTSGIAPGICYGAEVWGISDSEALKLRRVAAVALKPNSRCRSLTLAHLLSGMPTAKEEARAAIQYSKIVWRAVTRREHAEMRGTSLSDIRQQWEAAHAACANAVADYRASADLNAGLADPKIARRAWDSVRGPVSAAAMTLARIGWHMETAFKWRDAHGDEIALTTTSPAMISHLIIEATKDAAEKRIGAVWSQGDASLVGRRICPDLTTRAIASKCGGRLTALQTGALRAAACNGIYTRHRAHLDGYDIADVCTHCGAEGDTIHHRVYCCPYTRGAVLQQIPAWLYREGGRASPSSRFWTTSLFPHPADRWPRPAATFSGTVVGDTEGNTGLDGWEDEATGFGGYVYTDGSCSHSYIRGLSRAATAAAQVDDQGRRVRAIYLPVPRHLPQTSQAGEHVGVGVARRMSARPADIKCDCSNVVRAANANPRAALAPARLYAGVILDKYTRHDDASNGTTVSWVKAHRAEREGEDAATLRDIRGNAIADELAGEAVGLHPQPTVDQQADLDFYSKRAPLVARAIGAALALFPAAEAERMSRRPRAESACRAKELNQHYWVHEHGRWRCDLCGTWAVGEALTKRHEASRCPGHIADARAEKWAALGHKIARVSGPVPFAFCCRCGAWGSRRTRNLAKACAPPTPAGTLALKRIERGKHPWRNKTVGGNEAPRANIAVISAFNGNTNQWQGVGRHNGGSAKRRTGRDSGGATSSIPRADAAAGTAPTIHAHADAATDADIASQPFHSAVDPLDYLEEDPFGHGGALTQECATRSGATVAQAASTYAGSSSVDDANPSWLREDSCRTSLPTEASPSSQGPMATAAHNWATRKRGPNPSVRLEALRDRVRRRLADTTGAKDLADGPLADSFGPITARGEAATDQPLTRSLEGSRGGSVSDAQASRDHQRLRAQCSAADASPPADQAGADSARVNCLRADIVDYPHRQHHQHRLHRIDGHGEHRRHDEGRLHPGHEEQSARDHWGGGSRCSPDPPTVPPSHQVDNGGGGVWLNLKAKLRRALLFLRDYMDINSTQRRSIQLIVACPLVTRRQSARAMARPGMAMAQPPPLPHALVYDAVEELQKESPLTADPALRNWAMKASSALTSADPRWACRA